MCRSLAKVFNTKLLRLEILEGTHVLDAGDGCFCDLLQHATIIATIRFDHLKRSIDENTQKPHIPFVVKRYFPHGTTNDATNDADAECRWQTTRQPNERCEFDTQFSTPSSSNEIETTRFSVHEKCLAIVVVRSFVGCASLALQILFASLSSHPSQATDFCTRC